MKLKMPPYVDRFVDRGGAPRYYFRKRGGPRIPLPGLPWSAEFMAAYKAAAEGQGAVSKGTHAIVRGSVEAAIIGYLGSNDWKQQAQTSRELRKPIIERFRLDYGVHKLRALRRSHVQQIIADKTPSAQSNWLKALRHFAGWAMRENLIATDPCAGVQTARKPQTGGFMTWTEAHVASYRDMYPLGGKPRLALELMLNLGVRISDARQIGPQHIQNGVLTDYRPQKGRTTNGHTINVPVHGDLAKAITAMKVTGATSFLVTSEGNVYTAKYLGQHMREWCNDAKLPECTSHGLRKLCLVRLAEAGCSPHELMSISGHKNLKEVETYTAAASRKKLAVIAMAKRAGIALDVSLPLDKLREAYTAATGAAPVIAGTAT
ncbi:integrase [Bradyrhizobium japonicum]|uniref:tyrosine-type recombinase/integrase n=1 Tax=Bradyrhizobium japonicum TaxID=375 RepID=UPI002167C122|nr:site-specific integrase [Bradyrhizobium japonicum]MCS3496199.1 integrase [Bradyrhizobium japonicum]MCS3961638.1 integrase [Bradyrhizobium japonicum]MCS3993954.1 integrase [Bradyrhizobium japonicum]